MTNSTDKLISESRQGIRTYTNNFTGEIGESFKTVDERLENAQNAIEEDVENEKIKELLQNAQRDLQKVIRNYFTGISPGNLSEYVEEPVSDAVETLEE